MSGKESVENVAATRQELSPLSESVDDNVADGAVTIEPIELTETRLERVKRTQRATWGNKLQFTFTVIGYSVGLGNIWRFPYLCQKNGGGAFLIPFMVMLILEGIPLFLIELGIGQRLQQGSLGVWNYIHPWLGGIGLASTLVSFLVGLYYNVIITWCFYYLFSSFQSPLPWAECPSVTVENVTTMVTECELSSATEYYWFRQALDISPRIDMLGNLKWWMVLCLLLAWLTVYLIMMRGIQSSGKVVYFTALFPYLVLTIFFVRGITLKGAGDGLIHMFSPKLEMLANPTVWLDAANQVFYSFGLAFGSLIAFGSYNKHRNNCIRDVIFISICNAITAIYACAVIFSILGFKATLNFDRCNEHKLNSLNNTADAVTKCDLTEELDKAAEGTGLAFIVFTQAIVELPGAPFWAVIFFLMLLALGLGSQIGILEGVISNVFDLKVSRRVRKEILSGIICGCSFLIGLLFVSGSGEYWLTLFDSYAAMGLTVIALLEMVAITYVYGIKRFSEDIYAMTGVHPGLYWQVTWRFVGPFILAAVTIASVIFRIFRKPEYLAWQKSLGRGKYINYPGWVLGVCGILSVAGIIPVLLVFLCRYFQCVKWDLDIHQGSIKRIETTISTKEMITDDDQDGSVSNGQENVDVDFGQTINFVDLLEPIQEYYDVPINEDRSDHSDNRSDCGVEADVTEPLKATPACFEMEVMD